MDNTAWARKWIDEQEPAFSSLTETQQRVHLFASHMNQTDPDLAALVFQLILEDNYLQRDSGHKTLADAAVMSLVTGEWDEELRARSIEAATAFDVELARIYLKLARLPEVDKKREEEKPFQYPGEKPLSLGERRFVASRPSRLYIEKAMSDPHPMVTTKLLSNPKLTENDVIIMATKRPGRPEQLAEIAMHKRWRRRRQVASALLFNPALPPGVGLLSLLSLHPRETRQVAEDRHLDATIRKTASLFFALNPQHF